MFSGWPTDPPSGEIAFGSSSGIYVVSPDGTGLARLNPTGFGGVAWSPDGSKIAFGSGAGIATVDPHGGHVTPVVATGQLPSYSPTAAKIAYSTGSAIIAADASGANPTTIVSGTNLYGPVWSPDGTKIAYTSGVWGDVFVVSSNGGPSDPPHERAKCRLGLWDDA